MHTPAQNDAALHANAPSAEEKHARPTRIAHMLLALLVITQLCTSLIFEHPRGTAFLIHEISGLSALVVAFCFWMIVAGRRWGTPVGLLFPWFSAVRLRELFADIGLHLRYALRLQLPPFDGYTPLASAVHGLGLALISTMAATGTIWFVRRTFDLPSSPFFHYDMTVHHVLANVVWVYLIGHAALGILQQLVGQAKLTRMWS